MTGCYPNSSPQAAAAAHCVQCQCFDVPPRLCLQRPAKSSQNLATTTAPASPSSPARATSPPLQQPNVQIRDHKWNQHCPAGTKTDQQRPKLAHIEPAGTKTGNQQTPKTATSRHQKWQPVTGRPQIRAGDQRHPAASCFAVQAHCRAELIMNRAR